MNTQPIVWMNVITRNSWNSWQKDLISSTTSTFSCFFRKLMHHLIIMSPDRSHLGGSSRLVLLGGPAARKDTTFEGMNVAGVCISPFPATSFRYHLIQFDTIVRQYCRRSVPFPVGNGHVCSRIVEHRQHRQTEMESDMIESTDSWLRTCRYDWHDWYAVSVSSVCIDWPTYSPTWHLVQSCVGKVGYHESTVTDRRQWWG